MDQVLLTPRKRFTIGGLWPICWLRSDAGTGGGATVQTWTDQSGNGNSPTQATAGSRPALTANQINGYPSLDFDGTKSLAKAFGASLSQPYSIAIVCKFGAAGVVLDSSSGAHAEILKAASARYQWTGGTTLDGISGDGGWHVIIAVANGTTSVLHIDGHERGGAGGAAALPGIILGMDSAAANGFTGSIAEVLVFSDALTVKERRKLGAKLAAKYALQRGKTKIVVSGTGTKFWNRLRWDSSNDYINGMDLASTSGTTPYWRDTVNFRLAGTVASTTADASLPATTPTATLHDETDDIAPLYVNSTYIGGNHGGSFIHQVTATGHGKDATDVGSEWVDGQPTKFYLMRVVDANTLWFLSENASGTTWTFDAAFNGSTLTHSAGAAHTGAITIGADSAAQQLFPATYNTTRKIYRNGNEEITADGTYLGDYFDVVHSYRVKDVDAILVKVIANRGSVVAWNSDDVDDIATVELRYRFQSNGAVTVYQTCNTLQTVYAGSFGHIQFYPTLAYASGTRHLYMPKIAPFTPVATEYNFEAIQDVTSLGATVSFASSAWRSATDPPDRYTMISKTSGGVKGFAFTAGYNVEKYDGVPATRAANVTNAGYINSSTKKVYPYLKNFNSGLAAGKHRSVCYRVPVNYNLYSAPTSIVWYECHGVTYLSMDFHADYNAYVALPPDFVGKQVTVVEKHANCTINSTTVESAGIDVDVVSGYGWATVKLT